MPLANLDAFDLGLQLTLTSLLELSVGHDGVCKCVLLYEKLAHEYEKVVAFSMLEQTHRFIGHCDEAKGGLSKLEVLEKKR